MVDRYETARLACLRCLVKEFQRFAPSEQLASSSPCGREEELTDPLQEEAKQPLQRALGKEWQVVVDEGSLVSWEEVIDSPSYPSLTTQYKMQQLSAVVSGLPSSPFVTYESGAEGGKEHYWEWREDSPNDLRRPPTPTPTPTTTTTATTAPTRTPTTASQTKVCIPVGTMCHLLQTLHPKMGVGVYLHRGATRRRLTSETTGAGQPHSRRPIPRRF